MLWSLIKEVSEKLSTHKKQYQKKNGNKTCAVKNLLSCLTVNSLK